ncbi:hypothetical protein JL722_2932 [Aureococcus anophagefferens]|nr:hypothetical protein JL722_2932 [Aureococcus anophagefferens]
MAPKPAPPKKRLSVVEALQASVAAALGAAEDTEEAVVLEAVLQKKGSGARPARTSRAPCLDGCGVAAAAKRGGAAHVFEVSSAAAHAAAASAEERDAWAERDDAAPALEGELFYKTKVKSLLGKEKMAWKKFHFALVVDADAGPAGPGCSAARPDRDGFG